MTTQPRHVGILLRDDLAQAAHEGRKTVTRRPAAKMADPSPGHQWGDCYCLEVDPSDAPCAPCHGRFGGREDARIHVAGVGYVGVGDLAYVRETFQVWTAHGSELGDADIIVGRLDDCWYNGFDSRRIVHRAASSFGDGPWRPSIHMPKWAARTWGRVTGVRGCDLSRLSTADARAEGFNTAEELRTALRSIYPGTTWFVAIEWEPCERPTTTNNTEATQ